MNIFSFLPKQIFYMMVDFVPIALTMGLNIRLILAEENL